MKFNPIGDRVIVKVDISETKAGEIVIPDDAKEKPMTGVVVAVGPGGLTNTGLQLPMTVKKDDKVLFGKYGGAEIQVEDDEKSTYLIMHESDIYAIINS